jgi:zinc protease
MMATWRWLGRALPMLVFVAGACGAAGKRSSGNPASIDVVYETSPEGAPAGPPKDYWKGRSDLITAPAPPRPAALELPKIERFKLKNGLDVVVVARNELPVVSFDIAIKAGGYDEDNAKTLGVAGFTAAMLVRGTRARSADDISRAIDFVGGALNSGATNESSQVSCSALAKDTRLCLDLLADVLIRPTFPEAEMPEVRDQVIAELESRYDNPGALASLHFANLLFGEKHPDGWVLMPEDARKITRDHLVAFWSAYYRPNNAVLAVAGDVDPARLRAELEQALGAWKKAAVPPRPAFKPPELRDTRLLLVDRPDLTQATLVLGHLGLRHADPDWYAASLANYALGGSDFSSRLMAEVRSKRGLTYGIGSSFGASLYEGAFRVSASTKNASVWEALVATVAEIRRMKAEGPTTTELAKAKGFYAGSYPFRLQTAAVIADTLVAAELHGLGLSYVRDLPLRLAAVDEAQAKRAAAERLFPDNLWVVVIGKADEIEPEIAKAGIAYERIHFKDPPSYAARNRLRRQQQPAPQR